MVRQWKLLADAGLPSSQRAEPSPSHRPHITLFAGAAIEAGADAALPGLVAGLDLTVRIGSVLLFGPRRGQYVLVRQVLASTGLIELQHRVATACGSDPDGQFGPGRWTPHITLAPRIRPAQIGPALDALGAVPEVDAHVVDCRRWDSERRTTWWLTS